MRARCAEAPTSVERKRTRVNGGLAADDAIREDHPHKGEVDEKMTEDRDAGTDGEELEFGSKVCVCPKCGVTVPHRERGRPCSTRRCPKCGSAMKGEQCRG